MDDASNTDDIELGTIECACEIIGGDKPINKSTYYRGVASGIFPKPIKIGGLSRVNIPEVKRRLRALLAARDHEAA